MAPVLDSLAQLLSYVSSRPHVYPADLPNAKAGSAAPLCNKLQASLLLRTGK